MRFYRDCVHCVGIDLAILADLVICEGEIGLAVNEDKDQADLEEAISRWREQ